MTEAKDKHPAPTVTVPRTDLERVRDLLMERIYGSPARSPAHNARLEVEDMLAAAPAAPQAAGAGEKPLYDRRGGYLSDPEGLARMRESLIATVNWHDPAPINCNSLARLLDTIEALRAPSREPEGGAVTHRQALERIGNREMRRELGAGDYGVDRSRCPSCSHAWDDGKPEHHADECALKIAQAALATREEAPAEDDARRKLIGLIEQWDGESEYDAEDVAALADDILHAFNGPPVVSEEAPAEAGPMIVKTPCQHCLRMTTVTPDSLSLYRDHLRAQPQARDLADEIDDVKKALEADGQVIEYFEVQRRIAALKALRGTDADKQAVAYIDTALSALKAHEDTQPFGWVWRIKGLVHWNFTTDGADARWADYNDWEHHALYTHPASDALRAAVEALEPFAKAGGLFDTGKYQQHDAAIYSPAAGRDFNIHSGHLLKARKALAALQAEQKGGAA